MEKLDQLEAAEQITSAWTDASIKSYADLVPTPIELADDEIVECESCGIELDPRRARSGYVICTDCKREEERRSKLYGKRNTREWD